MTSRCDGTNPRGEAGVSMPALLAMLAIMALALMLALPSWRYLETDEKEVELIFRGRQISNAISRFQRKNGNAFPVSFEQLVQGHFLRKAYKDPMTKAGRWRILRPGEAAAAVPGAPRIPGSPGPKGGGPTPSPSATPVFGDSTTTPGGPIAGVTSTSTEESRRSVNGVRRYNQWVFAPNVPFILGAQPLSRGPAGGPNQVPAQNGLRVPDAEMPRLSR